MDLERPIPMEIQFDLPQMNPRGTLPGMADAALFHRESEMKNAWLGEKESAKDDRRLFLLKENDTILKRNR